ncbi:hypothetical protein [Paenibacillus prosopidis]|nr:hypothetical protein [Paenibacillus prosopidis]
MDRIHGLRNVPLLSLVQKLRMFRQLLQHVHDFLLRAVAQVISLSNMKHR